VKLKHIHLKRPINRNWDKKRFVGKVIPVTGRGGPYGSETPRLPHF
jgi:hypothetical protein